MAAAQQRDHQSADHGVLADDGLGDLAAQGQQRVSRRVLIGCLHDWLRHDCATCLSMLSSARARFTRSESVAGGGPNSMCPSRRGLAAALGDGLHHRRRRRGRPRPKPRQQPLQRRGAQRIGRAIAGPLRAIQPAAALDRLRCPHHHGKPLGHQRTDAPALPHRQQRDDQAQLPDHPRHLVGDQIEHRCRAGIHPRCVAAHTRSPAAGLRQDSSPVRRCPASGGPSSS